jgi:YfiH family protein
VERRTLSGGVHAVVSSALEREGFLAAFTERGGGVSDPPYRSLNLGFNTGDRPENVAENRRRAVKALDVPGFASAEQVHGAEMVRVGDKKSGAGFDAPGGAIGGADALAVTRDRLPVAVLVADCLPIALASSTEGCLVAVHAGWRSLAAGILDRAVGAFHDPAGIAAAIGPAIGPCHYEVGEDVALAVGAGSPAGVVTERRDGKLFLDLAGTAARMLSAVGVRSIDRAGLCTAHEPRRFYSHRRDGTTGRQALIAMRV